jgi:hypothetical protein
MCEIQIATLDLKGPNIFVTNLKLAHFIRKTTWNLFCGRGFANHTNHLDMSMVYLNTFDDDSKQFKLNVSLYQIVQTKQKGCSCLLMHFKSIPFHKLTTSSHKLI